jgi:hypothetical protein
MQKPIAGGYDFRRQAAFPFAPDLREFAVDVEHPADSKTNGD